MKGIIEAIFRFHHQIFDSCFTRKNISKHYIRFTVKIGNIQRDNKNSGQKFRGDSEFEFSQL